MDIEAEILNEIALLEVELDEVTDRGYSYTAMLIEERLLQLRNQAKRYSRKQITPNN